MLLGQHSFRARAALVQVVQRPEIGEPKVGSGDVVEMGTRRLQVALDKTDIHRYVAAPARRMISHSAYRWRRNTPLTGDAVS